ncbi:fumarylacetoacetate hydrolase family protein [Chthonobacter albigriseus]|uniref:fumarylacetoacetate hydrolase family protein n=1 Tax=Chthonobacter albigriseus TaxID=1683161 RepID=UPI0015EFD855|nr:fumarylacetoacetate hydrolase family protein [Chthonobacter albigriseus]
MKLATLKDRTRDGMLVVVSRDLTRFVSARPIAATLQAALDDWEHAAPRLLDLAHDLELGALPTERFHEHHARSPLPRAYQRIDGEAYAGLGNPDSGSETDGPRLVQAASDSFVGPRDPILAPPNALDIDLEGGIAVLTGDVPLGASRDEAAAAIRLVMLVNDVGFGGPAADRFAQAGGRLPFSLAAFSPVAVTPDELGPAWDGGKVDLPLLVSINGKPFGKPNAARDVRFDAPALIEHAARTRPLGAGSIIGSGPVSNRGVDGGPGQPLEQGGVGFASIAARRRAETMVAGAPATAFLAAGDTVRIEMKDKAGHSIFGAIEQSVAQAGDAAV